MVQEDPQFTRIAPFYVSGPNGAVYLSGYRHSLSDTGLSLKRWNQYQKVFGDLGLHDGFVRDLASGSVMFRFVGPATLHRGPEMDVCYEPVTPKLVVDDLDDYNYPRDGTILVAYKHLQGQWYICLAVY